MPSFLPLEKFLCHAENNPSAIAIVDNSEEITYNSLLKAAQAVAYQLRDIENEWIGINPDLGWQSLALIYGVWYSGNGYVPISKKWPEARVKEVQTQAKIHKILNCIPDGPLLENNQEGAKAYLLFTSGSTGKPKGVPISRTNLNAFTKHCLNHSYINFNSKDRFLQAYDLSFDVSVFCFSIPLCFGANVVLTKKGSLGFPELFKAIQAHNITVCSFVPSVIRLSKTMLPRANFPSIRYSFFSGEALPGNIAKLWMEAVPNAQVYNCYGPTETVIVCTEEHLNSLDPSYFTTAQPIPLGKPFDGVRLQLENDEIVLNGLQVFDNYLGNSNKLEKFHTGDFAQYDTNQKLMFKGRKDGQIQWNGHRLELQEIDTVLGNNGIESKTIFEHQPIVFYAETSLNPEEILHNHLPSYLIPKKYFSLKKIPLNTNGKTDFTKLKSMLK